MDHLMECFIHLDDHTVYSGRNLTGKVVVDFKERREVRNICVEVEGDGCCEWTETEGSSKKKITYTGREQLLRLETYVAGNQAGKNFLLYDIGRYSFPFNFALPVKLPSSLEDDLGHIRYNVKVVVDKPWNDKANSKASFIVKEFIDTNHPSYCNTKPGKSASKQVVCCCFPLGILILNGNINHSAYCNGEAVDINVVVQNQSTYDMRAWKAKLTKKIECHAQNISKTTSKETIISKIQGAPIHQCETKKFSNNELMILTTVPSVLNCNIIKVSYELSIYVDVPCAIDLDIKIPIIVGTVPRRSIGFASDLDPQEHTSVPHMDYPDMPQSSGGQRNLPEPEMPPSYDSIWQ